MRIIPDWLEDLGKSELKIVLREYGNLVHRFPQFIGLVIGHAENATVRRLLLPNLIDEIGDDRDNPAHIYLFEICAASCGLQTASNGVSQSTQEIENWFFSVFNSADTARSLAVLGPGTEEIAQSFLVPMERCLVRAFDSVDLRYFEVHRPQFESMHIGDIRQAIHILRNSLPESERFDFDAKIEADTHEALAMHARFWDNLYRLVFNPH
jgi:Iron-containing redox enzyme